MTTGAIGRAAPRTVPATAPGTAAGVRQALDTTVRLDGPLGAHTRRLGHLLDMFPPAVDRPADPAARYAIRTVGGASLVRDGDVIARADDAGGLVVPLFADLTAVAMAAFTGFAAHAAVVTGPAGSVALLGESGTGKSTLTAACLGAGLGFCSDEALCLRYDTAAVVPFPRPVSLLADSPMLPAAAGPRRGGYLHAGELGGVVDHTPPPVAHIVILGERVTGAPMLTPGGPADGVQALLRMGFNHFRAPARAVDVATRVVAGAAVWHLRAGDPGRTATALADLVGGSAGVAGPPGRAVRRA